MLDFAFVWNACSSDILSCHILYGRYEIRLSAAKLKVTPTDMIVIIRICSFRNFIDGVFTESNRFQFMIKAHFFSQSLRQLLVEPQAPRIEYKASAVLPGHNVTVKAGEKATVKCVSRYGNPPAKLKWFLGDEELIAKSNQTNSPEADNRRTWSALSVIEISAEKSQNGRMLRCVALHESYPSKSLSVDVRLDVTCKYI
ncbi:hypothetical protein M8J77_006763 [Diaphorina citri]|nr:hypothetical protein M8J77_006763 [Diaphorina citri]